METSLTHSDVFVKNDQKHVNLDKLRIKKMNKTHHMLVGEFVFHHEFDDNYQIACLAYKKTGNDYKLLPYKVGPTNFCEFFRNEKMIYPDIKVVTDFPEYSTCPWPAGIYHIYGFSPDLSRIPPILDSGDYMVEFQYRKGEEILNKLQIFGTLLIKVFG